jgi:peptidoglycan lytic transglycosylase
MATRARALAVAATTVLLTLPASAGASTGGATVPKHPATSPGSGNTAGRSVLLGKAVSIRGNAGSSDGQVQVERKARGGSWQTIDSVTADGDGSFSMSWKPTSAGRFELRAVRPGATSADATSESSISSPGDQVTVYRPVKVTWYGPGSWNSTTACGIKLRRNTLGVAHKTLPCGTKVALSYHGHETVAEVIDRGPYANGASYDLTQATARQIGMTGTSYIGALRLH